MRRYDRRGASTVCGEDTEIYMLLHVRSSSIYSVPDSGHVICGLCSALVTGVVRQNCVSRFR